MNITLEWVEMHFPNSIYAKKKTVNKITSKPHFPCLSNEGQRKTKRPYYNPYSFVKFVFLLIWHKILDIRRNKKALAHSIMKTVKILFSRLRHTFLCIIIPNNLSHSKKILVALKMTFVNKNTCYCLEGYFLSRTLRIGLT